MEIKRYGEGVCKGVVEDICSPRTTHTTKMPVAIHPVILINVHYTNAQIMVLNVARLYKILAMKNVHIYSSHYM